MWWTEEIEGLVAKKREKLCQICVKHRSISRYRAYLETERQTRRIIRAQKNEMWDI